MAGDTQRGDVNAMPATDERTEGLTEHEESANHACCLTTDHIPYLEEDRTQKIINSMNT
jgi:hypothetical protein